MRWPWGSQSRGAMNAEQFYVSLSRAKSEAKVYTGLPPEELKQAIQRTDTRKSATELMARKKRKPKASRIKWWMDKARDRFRKLREPEITVSKEHERDGSMHMNDKRETLDTLLSKVSGKPVADREPAAEADGEELSVGQMGTGAARRTRT